MQLGNRIAARRIARGMTQAELGETMHVTRQTVSRWENNSVLPDIEKVSQLAELLGVSCDYLLNENASPDDSTVKPVQKTAAKHEPSRLLMNLVGKNVEFSFYNDEEDVDLYNKKCIVLNFDGTWFKVRVTDKNGTMEKLVAAASVLSVKILGEEA